MRSVLPGIADARSRVAVWNALQLAVADAEVDPAEALDIVIGALPAETESRVLDRIGRWAHRTVAGTYLSGATRPDALARIAGAMLDLSAASAPGSGRQLAAARVAIAATVDSALLRGCLEEEGTPDGLEVDTELRWTLLERLAPLGDLSAEEIDAAAAADHSSAGAVHAARCRASRPDADAKADAWAAMLHDPDAPNYELYALADGFWDPAQRELTEPYVERYFAEIAGTAAIRSGWVVDRMATLAYPWPMVEAHTAAATRDLLTDQSLHSGIRRSVIDVGDDLDRALAVRARFAPDVA
jgi:aminopeptidase N